MPRPPHPARAFTRAALAACLVLSGAGCSCGSPPSPAAPDSTPAAVADARGVIARITASGAPSDPEVPAEAVPSGCAPGPRAAGFVRIGADDGLADVVTWLRRGARIEAAEVATTRAPADHGLAILDCRLEPRALVARRADTLVLRNGDDRFHTVHLWRVDGGRERSVQTVALAPGESEVRLDLEQPGLYRLKSDQIPFVMGLLLVLKADELAAVTDADGGAELPDVPAGSWDVLLVHATLGEAETTVEVVAGEAAPLYGSLPNP